MKKMVSLMLVLTLILCAAACPAMAAGKMTVQQENFHVVDSYGVYGYGFARVENTGDKPVVFSAGLLEIYDANGDTLTSTDYISYYPDVLQPGDVGYIFSYDSVDDAESIDDVDDYMLTVTGKSTDNEVVRYPATGSFQENVQISEYSSANYISAEITNDTDETVYDMDVVIALLDAEGNIMMVENNAFYNVGVTPGSTITYRREVYDSWYEAWAREGLTPAQVEVIAFTETW